MELLLIRHGDMAGDPHRHYEPPVEGCLSDVGREQAAQLGRALADVPLTAVYSSPLGRAVETAQAVVGTRTFPITLLPWMIEWRPATIMGECDEANYESMMAAAAKLRPEQSWKTVAGEGTLEMAHRIIPNFIALLESLGVHAGHGGYLLDNPEDEQRIALVAHGGSLGTLSGFLLGLPIKPYGPIAFEQTGVMIVSFVKRVDVWYPTLRIRPPA